MDGASYHVAASTVDLIQKLRIPVMILGPYSYDASPCELFFAHFKNSDINPRHVPTTKGHFDKVVQLVMEKIKLIPTHQLVLH